MGWVCVSQPHRSGLLRKPWGLKGPKANNAEVCSATCPLCVRAAPVCLQANNSGSLSLAHPDVWGLNGPGAAMRGPSRGRLPWSLGPIWLDVIIWNWHADTEALRLRRLLVPCVCCCEPGTWPTESDVLGTGRPKDAHVQLASWQNRRAATVTRSFCWRRSSITHKQRGASSSPRM